VLVVLSLKGIQLKKTWLNYNSFNYYKQPPL